MAKSTGTLVPLALSNAFILRGVDLDRDGALTAQLSAYTSGTVGLLFPERAAPITEAPPGLACLLVPDGSWAQARSILETTRSLQRLPRFGLPPGLRGEYRIRKPQGSGRLSTLEAVVVALRILEDAPEAYEAALGLQRAMVERQLAHMRAGGAHHPALGTGRWRGRGGAGEGV